MYCWLGPARDGLEPRATVLAAFAMSCQKNPLLMLYDQATLPRC